MDTAGGSPWMDGRTGNRMRLSDIYCHRNGPAMRAASDLPIWRPLWWRGACVTDTGTHCAPGGERGDGWTVQSTCVIQKKRRNDAHRGALKSERTQKRAKVSVRACACAMNYAKCVARIASMVRTTMRAATALSRTWGTQQCK